MDAASLVRAFTIARDTAYKGVVRPVEGTILTVAKDVAFAAEKSLEATNEPYRILELVVTAADQSVQHTPNSLPVLKAGWGRRLREEKDYFLSSKGCCGRSMELSVGYFCL